MVGGGDKITAAQRAVVQLIFLKRDIS
jgi:hypothetical protein